MSNKLYDFLRFLTALLPALGTLYYCLADIWNLPLGDKIVATIAGVTAFLSALLQIISKNYFADKRIEDDTE